MKKIIFALSVLFLFIISIPKTYAYTSHPLDHILSYDVWISTNNDATLNCEYQIKWKVLDSSSEGVTWVKIGVPNKFCTNVVSLSNDIKTINYRAIDGGTYVRCDLVKEYMAGEIIDIHFRFHQSHMFTILNDGETKLVSYKYTPGWFDDIETDRLTIHWNKTNVYYNNAKDEDGVFYTWETSLGQGERTSASISYDINVFPNINEDDTYVGPEDYGETKVFFIVICIILGIVAFFCILDRIFRTPSYYRTRGFYPYGRRFFYRNYYYGVNDRGERKVNPYVSSGGSGHSGHSCACACACACAGGGRAGCSKKDFYKGNIKIDDLIDKLEA